MISERLRELAKAENIRMGQFEAKYGFSQGYLAKNLNNPKSLNSDSVANIIKDFPEVNARWLMTGQGEMYITKDDLQTLHENIKSRDREIKALTRRIEILEQDLDEKKTIIKYLERKV